MFPAGVSDGVPASAVHGDVFGIMDSGNLRSGAGSGSHDVCDSGRLLLY